MADFLPVTKHEMEKNYGWAQPDFVYVIGDAYVDHSSFGPAIISRVLESRGYKIAMLPQPDWHDENSICEYGRPRLGFLVSAGNMDSMVNHYTVNRKKRSEDAYSPGGKAGRRPDYATVVYCNLIKRKYKDVPIIIGGIEASLRRLAHYDYWQDKLRPSIMVDAPVDIITYGMGELATITIADALRDGKKIEDLVDIPQTIVRRPVDEIPLSSDDNNIVMHSFENCLQSKRDHAENFRNIEIESNKWHGRTMWQKTGDIAIKVNPMNPPMTSQQIDASFDLPYTRLPHPRYKGKRIPAYEMIRHSVNMHRGCFGGCAFCTISAHQGKFIASRSKQSIMREVKQVVQMEDFKGYISDLGGPSANMYGMHGHDLDRCSRCTRPSCLHPKPCSNLNNDHSKLLDIYHTVDALPQVKKSFIGSGVRYDLSMHKSGDSKIDKINAQYNEELIRFHVSGRLKVAPEHTSDAVLNVMRKPSFDLFRKFKQIFDRVNSKYHLNQQIIPYFISSHPGCQECDMADLAVLTRELDFHLEQVQDFTPTPMTVSTEAFYTGLHPYTLQPIFTAHSKEEKLAQRRYFFWYDKKYKKEIIQALRRLHRPDLIKRLYPKG